MAEPLTLATSIQYAKGVGEKRAALLAELGVRTCGDLLFYLPRDFLRYTDEAPVSAMRIGDVATIRGTVLQTQLIPRRPRRFVALLEDASGTDAGRCVLTWFNAYGLDKKITPGTQLRATGKVTLFRNRLQMVQPKAEVLDGKGEEAFVPATARIEPVYRASGDLPSPMIWKLVKGLLDPLIPLVPEWFDAAYLAERHLLGRQEALRKMHHPATLQETIQAKRSLAYHEFFLHQAVFAIKRYHARSNPALPLRVDEEVDRRIRALLPFSLTKAQDHVIEAIRRDLAGTKPMNRLLQGDVGSGKTVVALYAMLAACATGRGKDEGRRMKGESENAFNGHQAALMAPTEILAEQHYITLTKLLEGKRVKIALLTGSVKGREREEVLRQIASGAAGIVVGTHALLSETVRFKSLAVVVVDEQHKFGVEQRSRIRTKPAGEGRDAGVSPHVLVMTATPIPRTLGMTAFGDLDVSVIDELPPGRMPIMTKMTPSSNRQDVYEWLGKRLAKGEQAYVVTPAIDEIGEAEEGEELIPEEEDVEESKEDGEADVTEPGAPRPRLPLTLRDAVSVQRELQAAFLKDFRVGLLHGRMDRETRQHIMERFRQHLIDVLVSTTVIEVGVDVPNAAVMVVEQADRFGLSSLHQLRGRVGRGMKQSWCVLLGDLTGDAGIARLEAMVKHTSGFAIAEEDLKLRGMGRLIGTAQSGRTDIHFADLLFDPQLLPLSRRDAFNVVAADPRLLDASHTNLRAAILERFAGMISLADVG